MEIVTIEKKTFELWKQRFENFVGRVDALCVPLRRKRDKWLDNCETCRLLNVSARTRCGRSKSASTSSTNWASTAASDRG